MDDIPAYKPSQFYSRVQATSAERLTYLRIFGYGMIGGTGFVAIFLSSLITWQPESMAEPVNWHLMALLAILGTLCVGSSYRLPHLAATYEQRRLNTFQHWVEAQSIKARQQIYEVDGIEQLDYEGTPHSLILTIHPLNAAGQDTVIVPCSDIGWLRAEPNEELWAAFPTAFYALENDGTVHKDYGKWVMLRSPTNEHGLQTWSKLIMEGLL